MELADLKKLLATAKRAEVSCAAGLNEDGDAVFLLHKSKSGKSLLADLEKEAGKLKGPCFGTASVDTDDDPKQVILTFNKVISGLDRKLKIALKGSGFDKVLIRAS